MEQDRHDNNKKEWAECTALCDPTPLWANFGANVGVVHVEAPLSEEPLDHVTDAGWDPKPA